MECNVADIALNLTEVLFTLPLGTQYPQSDRKCTIVLKPLFSETNKFLLVFKQWDLASRVATPCPISVKKD